MTDGGENRAAGNESAHSATRHWMNEHQVSEHTGVPVQTLRTWRRDGAVRVLPFHKIGRLVRYERGEVDDAIDAGRVDPA